MKKLLLIALLAMANTVNAQDGVWIEGVFDCGLWAKARKANSSVALEHLLIGTVNGMAWGSGVDLWRTQRGLVTRDQLYLWMDGWCLKHPLESVFAGLFDFANQQTNGAYKNRYWSK